MLNNLSRLHLLMIKHLKNHLISFSQTEENELSIEYPIFSLNEEFHKKIEEITKKLNEGNQGLPLVFHFTDLISKTTYYLDIPKSQIPYFLVELDSGYHSVLTKIKSENDEIDADLEKKELVDETPIDPDSLLDEVLAELIVPP